MLLMIIAICLGPIPQYFLGTALYSVCTSLVPRREREAGSEAIVYRIYTELHVCSGIRVWDPDIWYSKITNKKHLSAALSIERPGNEGFCNMLIFL